MEIEKRHNMLDEAGIKHEWIDRRSIFDKHGHSDLPWGWQIIVYKDNGDRLVSAIEGFGSHGYGLEGEQGDLIEIMGLLTSEEEEWDSVKGWLTAEEVFGRIKEAVG